MMLPNSQLPSKHIERQTLAQQVLDRLVLQLLDSSLKAGDRVATELQLMEEFDVSRSSIREAVKALQNLGILDSRPALGTFISSNQDVYSRLLLLASLIGGDSWEELLDICTAVAAQGLRRLRSDLLQDQPPQAATLYLAQLEQASGKGKTVQQFYSQTLAQFACYPNNNSLASRICGALAERICTRIPSSTTWKMKDFTERYQHLLTALLKTQTEFNSALSGCLSRSPQSANRILVEA